MHTLPAVAPPQQAIEALVEMALATCISKHTRRAYAGALSRFLSTGKPLNRESVALYVQGLREAGANPPTILTTLSAIRKLANEVQLRGLISHDEYAQIDSIKGGAYRRSKSGQWLTVPQVEKLLSLPDRATYFGQRNACILALLLGTGLRRSELAEAPWTCYQEREGRMCLVDIRGKGDKTRTVPIPQWAVPDVDAWREASRHEPPPPTTQLETINAITRKMDRSLICGGVNADRLWDLVVEYGQRMNVKLAPHDLRRTLAQLLRKAGAPLEQIQYQLGHADVATTVMYLGSSIELAPGIAAVDMLKISRSPAGTGLPLEDLNNVEAALEQERVFMRQDQERRRARAAGERPARPQKRRQGGPGLAGTWKAPEAPIAPQQPSTSPVLAPKPLGIRVLSSSGRSTDQQGRVLSSSGAANAAPSLECPNNLEGEQ